MPSLTIQLDEATFQLVEKYAAREGKEPALLVADIVAHAVEQTEAWEALRQRCAETSDHEKFQEIVAEVPNAPPLPGDELPELEDMNSVAPALVFAMAYLGSVERESDSDADDDVKALEEIASQIATMTLQERLALKLAAYNAKEAENSAESPNHRLISGYDDVLEHLQQTQN